MATTAWKHHSFAADANDGAVLSVVQADLSTSSVVDVDRVIGNTILRSFSLGKKLLARDVSDAKIEIDAFVDFSNLAGKPTTVAGYGITDAVSAGLIGAPDGLATLDSSGKLTAGQLPPISITDTFVVASQGAMLALTAQTGDVAVRTDLNKSYILKGTDPSVLADWQELLSPTDAVTSVNGQTGVVDITFALLSAKPTTIVGFGITDAYTKTELQTSGSSSVHYDNVSNKPTTIVGFGITDAYTKTELQTSGQSSVHFGNVSSKPTTLAGYGITDTVITDAFVHVANSVGANQFSAVGLDAVRFAAGSDLGVTFDPATKTITFGFTGSVSGITQAAADARYLQLTGGTLSGALSVSGTLDVTGRTTVTGGVGFPLGQGVYVSGTLDGVTSQNWRAVSAASTDGTMAGAYYAFGDNVNASGPSSLRFFVWSNERMRLAADGVLTLGPAATSGFASRFLSVSAGTYPGIVLERTSTTDPRKYTMGINWLGAGQAVWQLYDETAETARITVNQSGNVAIGTGAGTVFKLDVAGYGRYAQAVSGGIHYVLIHNNAPSASGNSARLALAPHGGFAASIAPYIEAYDDGMGDTGLAIGTYRSGLAERMRINGAGQLLVGTSSETLAGTTVARFSGTTPEVRITDEASYYASLSFYAKGGGTTPTYVANFATYWGHGLIYATSTGHGHMWRVNGGGDYVMRLFHSGRLAIGTNPVDAGYLLDVQGTARVNDVLTASLGVIIPGGTFAAGKLYKEPSYGTALVGQTGGTYDLALMTPTGQVALGVMTGSRTIEMGNALKVIGAFGANNNTPVGKQAVPAAASDLASVIALANAVRAAGVAFGLYS